jgi:protein arginine kinase
LDYTPIDLHDFAERVSSWMTAGSGGAAGAEGSDVVVSCRVRLARNLRGFPFCSRLAPERARELAQLVEPHLIAAALDGETRWVPMEKAGPVLRMMLRERHLISSDLAPENEAGETPPGRAVAFGETERLSVMVNEEDHLRIQSVAPGFDFDGAFAAAETLDRFLETRLPLAFTEKLGYLTGCPTNVGTGLRASVMLHLPGLGLVRSELEKVFAAAERTGLAVRGLHGEGSRAVGDFYQISNQVTLGRSEASLMEDLHALVPVIVNFERKVRSALFDDQPAALKDRISRSLGVLRTSRSLGTEAALGHISTVRLGRYLGILDATSMRVLNELGVQVQKGHLLALSRENKPESLPGASERDSLRAGWIRSRLAGGSGGK